MSGWGNKDDKTSAGTIAITTAGVVTGTSTNFDPELQVGDYLKEAGGQEFICTCLLYTSPSPRDRTRSRMPSSA